MSGLPTRHRAIDGQSVTGEPRRWSAAIRRLARVLFRSQRATKAELTRLAAEIDRLSTEQELLWRHLRAQTAARSTGGATYRSFLNRFRGSTESIRQRASIYLEQLRGHAPVVDLSCGRGELLRLLQDEGISARGIDIDEEAARDARAQGLDVTVDDAVSYLNGLAPESAGAIVMLQLVEHLPVDAVIELLAAANQALRSNGCLIIETVNVASWMGFSSGFLRDYTHCTPFHPDTLAHLVSCAGFEDVAVEYRSPCDSSSVLQHVSNPDQQSEAAQSVDRNIENLNHRLFGYQDYAVIARRR